MRISTFNSQAQVIGRNNTFSEWSGIQGGIRSPINSRGIRGFKRWLNVNGFRKDRTPPRETLGPDPTFDEIWEYETTSIPPHPAFDFMAYETQKGKMKVGLPSCTRVRSVLDGFVYEIVRRTHPFNIYRNAVKIVHSTSDDSALTAIYAHVNPISRLVEGSFVRKGEVIGSLMDFESNAAFAFQVHLHFQLRTENIHFRPENDSVRLEFAGHSDPLPLLFPDENLPFVQYVHPDLKPVSCPMPPVWPNEAEVNRVYRDRFGINLVE